MEETKDWEVITSRLRKMEVDGGTLYCFMADNGAGLCFAPNQRNYIDEIEEIVSRLNNMDQAYNDALLDFEKRLNDLKYSVDRLIMPHVANIKFGKPECQHEWDISQIYASNPPKLKCKKCHEFSDINPAYIPTLQLCAHGVPVKFNSCAVCNLASE